MYIFCRQTRCTKKEEKKIIRLKTHTIANMLFVCILGAFIDIYFRHFFLLIFFSFRLFLHNCFGWLTWSDVFLRVNAYRPIEMFHEPNKRKKNISACFERISSAFQRNFCRCHTFITYFFCQWWIVYCELWCGITLKGSLHFLFSQFKNHERMKHYFWINRI